MFSNKSEFDFIHIGKCGGSSINKQLDKHKIIRNHVHIEIPIYKSGTKYLINIRNPISRFVSSFNWRLYRLLYEYKLDDKTTTLNNELRILNKYENVNNYRFHYA